MTCLFLWRFIDGNVNYSTYDDKETFPNQFPPVHLFLVASSMRKSRAHIYEKTHFLNESNDWEYDDAASADFRLMAVCVFF